MYWSGLIVFLAHLEKLLWVVRYDTIDFLPDAPFHPTFIVHSPEKQWSIGLLAVSHEFGAQRSNHNLLEHVERDIWHFQKLACVCDTKSNVGDREPGEIV